MIEQVLQRYGSDLLQQPERLRNLVQHRCAKENRPEPDADSWLPFQELWLAGWPRRVSLGYWERYQELRQQAIRRLGGVALDPWLRLLPERTVTPWTAGPPQPLSEAVLTEALAQRGGSGNWILESSTGLHSPLPEGELRLSGSGPVRLELDDASWQAGWLRLESLELGGRFRVEGGLVEIRNCRLAAGARIQVTGPGALLVLEHCDLHGAVEAEAGSLVEVLQSNWDQAPLGLVSSGLVRLHGVAWSGHTQAALRMRQGGRAVAEDCQFRDCGVAVQFGGRSRSWLTHSWVRGNRICGAALQDDAVLEVETCNFRDNGGDALIVHDRGKLRLRNSTVQGNRGAGVRYGSAGDLEQSGNLLSDNRLGNFLEASI